MKVRVPKEFTALPPGQQRRIDEYWRNVAQETLERDGRVMLDLYIKMMCVTLHDAFGWGEKRLTLLLGHHRELFFSQQKMVRAGEQLEYLNKRMAEIFKKSGFPQSFFDKMLGSVESPKDERNGARVLNDSPVECQTPSVPEPQRER